MNLIRLGIPLLLAALLIGCESSGSGSGGGGSSSSGGGSSGPGPGPGTDHVTFKHDLARTGLNPTETTLTLSNVNAAKFGLLQNIPLDGKVDGQPLYLSHLGVGGTTRDVVYVVTEGDSVYAFDADSFAQLWHLSLIPAGETTSDSVNGCDQVVPQIGITSTPVIDRSAGPNGTIFVVAMTKDSAGNYHQRIHALDVTTGEELLNGPTEVSATYPGSGASPFNPKQYEERAALLLSQGVIYTSWTSHCDIVAYSGWVIGYDESTLAQKSVLNLAPNSNNGPSIWMGGSGPAADSSGNIYLLTANGAFETVQDSAGFPNLGDFGNSFVRISTAGGTLAVADYFAMYNELDESEQDIDLGSGGEMLLPDLTDASGRVRHLVVGAGKDGAIYVVDRDSMGKWNATSNQIYQELDHVGPGCFSSPAYFNGTVYYPQANAPVMAFPVTNALLSMSPSSLTTASFPWPGGSPAISANGTTNGIVWVVENSSQAVLHAYDARNLTSEIYNSNQSGARDQFGPGNKYIVPTIADGRVFVGTQNSVAIFGLLQ
jgi:hypothetical protein